MKKNILILIGIISLSYILIFLLSSKDITDYTIADTGYWIQTNNRLLTKTAYEYNNKEEIDKLPKQLGEWNGFNFKYKDYIYKVLNADIIMSRAYSRDNRKDIIWMDIINSKTGESFHKQRICAEVSGWTVDSEGIYEFRIADPPNPFLKFYINRLDISKGDEKQVLVYWFMFKKLGNKDAVTMIRINSPVNNNDTEKTFSLVKNFVEDQLFNAMYRQVNIDTITMAEDIISKHGNLGVLAIVFGILIPLGLILVGIMKNV